MDLAQRSHPDPPTSTDGRALRRAHQVRALAFTHETKRGAERALEETPRSLTLYLVQALRRNAASDRGPSETGVRACLRVEHVNVVLDESFVFLVNVAA